MDLPQIGAKKSAGLPEPQDRRSQSAGNHQSGWRL